MEMPVIDFQLTPSSRTPVWRFLLLPKVQETNTKPPIGSLPEPPPVIEPEDITDRLANRIISLSLVDNRGFEADTLEVSISDHDLAVALPERGARIRFAIGWRGTPLVEKGLFVVDEIEHSGAPDKLSVRARSADFREKLLEKRNKAYTEQTIEMLIKTIAKEHKLEHRVSPRLKDIKIQYKAQKNESDANLLSRLAIEYDAIATVKNGILLFIKAGDAKTASGEDIAPLTITRGLGDSHRYAISDRDRFTGIKANWQDFESGDKKWVLVGTDERISTLRKVYKNADDAQTAAKAEFDRIQRGNAAFSINLAFGVPNVFPESPIVVQGFKPEIDATEWIAVRVTHQLNDSGYTTQIECEQKAEKSESETSTESDSA